MTHSPLATHPQPARRPAIRTLAALTLSVALWASAFAGIRVGLHGYTPGHLTLLRFLVASTAFLLYAVLTRIRLPAPRDLPALLVMGFCGIAAYQVLLNYGEQSVSPSVASLLIASAPCSRCAAHPECSIG